MSTQAPVWFVALMSEYLAAWRQSPTARIVASYWAVLKDCNEGYMRQAALELERAGGEFPRSSGDWYQLARKLEQRVSVQAAIDAEIAVREAREGQPEKWNALKAKMTARDWTGDAA